MLVNLWSTPRTGSIWTSIRLLNELRSLGQETCLLTEMFNQWHMNVYRLSADGVIKNVHEYEPGACFIDYSLDPRGCVKKTTVYGPRERDVVAEEAHRLHVIRSHNLELCSLVLHNHTSPLTPGVYEQLKNRAQRNVYIGRRSFVQQLASYGVAIATHEFARFKEAEVPLGADDWQLRPSHQSLEELTERILLWRSLVDTESDEVLWYEDIDFSNSYPGSPIKQNRINPMLRLHETAQEFIRDCDDHFRNRLYEMIMAKQGNSTCQ